MWWGFAQHLLGTGDSGSRQLPAGGRGCHTMPTLTREEAKSALVHIVVNVFGHESNCNLAKALDRHAGRTPDILDVINISNEDINSLAYFGDKNKLIQLPNGDRGLLRMVKLPCFPQGRG